MIIGGRFKIIGTNHVIVDTPKMLDGLKRTQYLHTFFIIRRGLRKVNNCMHIEEVKEDVSAVVVSV